VAGVFGGFALRFVSWAGEQVWGLLQIIFEVVAPQVMVYIRRAAGALRTIIRDPIRFIGNLVRAGMQGLRQFATNFLTHLRASLIGWLTGSMSGANIYIPQGFNLREILKFVLSVLGLTWQNIRSKLVRAIGETAVAALETGFDIVLTLIREGPAAAWDKIVESINNLREMVIEQVMTFVRDRIVTAAITRLVSMLNPAGAFIQAIIAIYNTVMFFVERMRQIAQVAAAVIDSIDAIARGVITAAAARVEQTMAGLLTLVISFLARIAGLGRVTDAVTAVINRVRQPIDRALDRVVEWIVRQARRLASAAVGGARRAVGAALGWWRQRRAARIGRVNATLEFQGEGPQARLSISTSPPVPLLDFLANDPRVRTIPATHPVLAQIRQRAQQIDTIKRRPSGGGTVAEGTDIARLFSEIADLLPQLSVDRPPRSRVSWAGMRTAGTYQTAWQMDAVLLSIDSGGLIGSQPTQEPPLWTAVNVRRGAYIRGHLLNHHLFGPGSRTNLVPITGQTNTLMSARVEEPLKAAVLQQNKVVAFRVSVEFGSRPPRVHVPAETFLPTELRFQAWELTPGPGTGDAVWNTPVRAPLSGIPASLPNTLPADTPVGASRTRVNLSRDGVPTLMASLSLEPAYDAFRGRMGAWLMSMVMARMNRPTPFRRYDELTTLGLPSGFVAALQADNHVTLF
jgi:hypothetical protein